MKKFPKKRTSRLFLSLIIIVAIVAANAAIAFASQKIIAHGGGSVKGLGTTNTVEAVKQAISDGIEYIELDMNLTTDGKVVMLHDWTSTTIHYLGERLPGPISSQKFEEYKVFKRLEPLTLEKLIPIISANPQVKIVTDTKEETIKILTIIAKTYPEFINNFIPQIYFFDEFKPIKALGYNDIILTIYRQDNPNAKELIKFAKSNNLLAVTMPNYEAEKGLCRELSNQGVDVFVHPINTMEDAMRFLSMGAKMIYTSQLLPYEFTVPDNKYYLTVRNGNGTKKLVDEAFTSFNGAAATTLNGEGIIGITGLKLNGLSNGEYAVCYTEERAELTLTNSNARVLVLELYNASKEKFNQIEYLAVQNGSGIRILQKKVEYRLAEMKSPVDFNAISTHEKVIEILSKSLIVKRDESRYYVNGQGKFYLTGADRLDVIDGPLDRNMIPLADTLLALGATKVTMESSTMLVADYKGFNYRMPVGEPIVKKSMMPMTLNEPVEIYRQKSMASADTFEKITNRPYLEDQGVTIILPEGIKLDEQLKGELIVAALQLFN